MGWNQVLKCAEQLMCFHVVSQQLTQGLQPDASLFEMGVLIMLHGIATTHPAAQDCKAALCWSHAHGATECGVNTQHITAAGGLLGGMLATVPGLTTADQH